ncbi:hypothetical protein ACLINM_003480 [Vibrio parahaemolyticus]|uniref:hypothetical protein n=1 Tax=Vibrio parahaemolyticus TaxID=670 RepID=UPI00235F049D|nr:hypothetical protein [Vibrio parahaemolyticus]
MKFIEENILDYIKRTVEQHNIDPNNRKITCVELTPKEWDEVVKCGYARPNAQAKLRLPIAVPATPHKSLFPCHYHYVDLVMVRDAADEEF